MTTGRTLIVNCYYCKGLGRTGGSLCYASPKNTCETCEGEGRLRIGPDGMILGPQPMAESERDYESYQNARGRAGRAIREGYRASPPPDHEAPPADSE